MLPRWIVARKGQFYSVFPEWGNEDCKRGYIILVKCRTKDSALAWVFSKMTAAL